MATTKRERKVSNIVMIVLAAVIVVAGVVFFMIVRGGSNSASSPFTVSSKTGYANIERAGISYTLDKGTVLQDGDAVEALNGSEVGITGAGDTELFLADASKLKVKAPEAEPAKASVELLSGCLFSDARSAGSPLALEGSEKAFSAGDAVFVSDVRKGALTVQVLSGEVAFSDGSVVKSGESRTILTNQGGEAQSASESGSASASASSPEANSESSVSEGEKVPAGAADTTGKLTIGSLDSFVLEHALAAVKAGRQLTFSEDEINGELDRRQNEKTQLAEEAAETATAGEEGAAAGITTAESDNVEAGSQESAPAADAPASDGKANTPAAASSVAPPGNAKHTCTIQIRCDTILDNMGSLAEGKSKYVPKNGYLLKSTSMTFEEGESAFDVLKRACDKSGIALEYSYAPVYGSYYVEGIGNLYEFDCGDESGWMFKVNGWFPNYGSSEYKLSDGDAIEFCYSCRGLGEDVGA